MAEPLGEAVLKLSVDSSDYDSGIDAAEKKASGLSSSVGQNAAGAALVLGGVGIAAAGVGVAIGSSILKAADFEHAIDAVGAVAQASAPELTALHDAGVRIGKDTAFSATEAAGAMETLAANGLTAGQILGGAADATVALAAAGGTDLVTAADTASTAMALWNIQGSDMNDVVNRLAGAANLSRFGVEDMSAAIAMGGGAAQINGVSFQDFSTAIAATATSFSSGQDAGTSFKTFLNGLTPQTDKQKTAMKELGIITEDGSNQFYDASGNLKGMAEVTDILHNAIGPLTEEQKNQALQTIFGTDAMRMAAAMSQITGDQFATMSDKMKNTDAAEVAKQRMGNLKGAIENLKGSIETIQIQIGSKFLPVLTQLALGAAVGLPILFDNIGNAMAFLGDHMTIVAPILIALGGGILGLVVAGLVALSVAAWAVVTPFLIMAAPFIAIGAAIALLVAGIALLVIHWDELSTRFPILQTGLDLVKTAFGAIKDAIGWVIDSVKAFFGPFDELAARFPIIVPIIQTFKAALDTIKQALGEAKEKFINDMLPALQRVGDMFETIGKVVLGFIQLALIPVGIALGILKDTFTENWNLIKGVVETAIKLIADILKTEFDIIKQIIETGIEAARDIISVVMALIRGDWEGAWNGIKTFLSNLWENIKELLGIAWDGIKLLFSDSMAVIGAALELAWGVIKSLFSNTMDGIRDGLGQAWDTIKQIFSDSMGKIGEAVSEGLGHVKQFFADLPSNIIQAMGNLAGILYDFGLSAVQSMGQGLKDAAGGLASIAGGIKDSIVKTLDPRNWWSTPEEHYRPLFAAAFSSIAEEGKKNLPAIKGAVDGVVGVLSDGVDQVGADVKETLKGYFDEMTKDGMDWATDMATHLPPMLNDVARSIGTQFSAGFASASPEILAIMDKYISMVIDTGSAINDYLLQLPPEFFGVASDMGNAIVDGMMGTLTDGMTGQVTPFLTSVQAAINRWGEGIVADMSDAFKQALAISNQIASVTQSGGNTAVLGGASALTSTVSAVAATAAAAVASAIPNSFTDPQGYIDYMNTHQLASGTSMWRGGMTWVGERGKELVNLPRGSQVMNHRKSMRLLNGSTSESKNDNGGYTKIVYGDNQEVYPNMPTKNDYYRGLDAAVLG